MAGAFKKSLVWLGLVEPEDDEELADVAEAAGRAPADRAPIRRVRDDDVYGRRHPGGRLEEPTEAVIHPIPSAAREPERPPPHRNETVTRDPYDSVRKADPDF